MAWPRHLFALAGALRPLQGAGTLLGPAPLDDQRAAGIIMWVGGDFLFIIALALAIGAWAGAERREGERVDRRLSRAAREQG
ncbi:MAG: cytochrome c oxidase assembly protein [Actinobacteria bacterium]|nr:cytochrome c oxidase assembly protein [Actinomycetota bacterium]